MVKLSDLGEFGLIERIAKMAGESGAVRIGIGDDAAALEPTAGHLTLATSDMLLEGVHFDLSLCDPVSLGRKSLAVNLSDIAAMGARPRHFLLSLAIPPALPVEFLDSFVQGLLQQAAEFGAVLIGGDTCASRSGLVISITLLGEQSPDRVVRRSGAGAGDLLFVTGTLGDAAIGLELLKRGERGGAAVARHLDPAPRVREGLALAEAGIPTAMIDISDGLLADLGHILELSGRGARLFLERLPLSPSFHQQAASLAEDPYLFPLAGGEDYELLFTAPPAKREEVAALFASLGTPVSVIGEITPKGGLLVISGNGRPYPVGKTGYNHFARQD